MKRFLAILLSVAFIIPMFSACSDDDDYKCKDNDSECIANCMTDAIIADDEGKAKKCAKCVTSKDGCNFNMGDFDDDDFDFDDDDKDYDDDDH